jgi:septin family protein
MRSGNGFQFAHVDWSARVGAKKKKTHKNNGNETRSRGWSAREIADEAERIDGACDHIENPLPPGLIYGVMPHKAVDKAEIWAESQSDMYQKKTKKGIVEIKRAYRADAPIMSNGIISLPRERENEWQTFRDASLRWLKNHYRERLLSVVEHLDERHPHLHFYVVPLPGEDFSAVHEGYNARQKSRNKGEKAGETITAYKEAMKVWQNDFYNAVASKFELARLGPRRERKDREKALADRAQRELEEKQHELSEKQKKLAETQETIDAKTKTLIKNATIINQQKKQLNAEKAAWQTPAMKIGTFEVS